MRRPRKLGIATLLAASSLILAAPAGAAVTHEASFGGPGTGAAQFDEPFGIALNNTTGDVYVVDRDNDRIQQFEADGTFIRMWGRGVNQTAGGDVCPLAPGDVCQAAAPGTGAGWFNDPTGIAVDNSGGPAQGSVYVQDSNNLRIQRFGPDGSFELMWGKEVNLTTGANLCTAASGNQCRAGVSSPEPGVFAGWGHSAGVHVERPALAVDGQGNVYVGEDDSNDRLPHDRVQKFSSTGAFLGQIAALASGNGFSMLRIAVNAAGDVYLVDGASDTDSNILRSLDSSLFTPGGDSGSFGVSFNARRNHGLAVDPYNQFLFVEDANPTNSPGNPNATFECGKGSLIREYRVAGAQAELVDCTPVAQVIDATAAMAVSPAHELYATDLLKNQVHVFTTPVAAPPAVASQSAADITAGSATIKASVAGNLAQTTVSVQYGPAPCSANPCQTSADVDAQSVGFSVPPKTASLPLKGLGPETTYFYRVLASNEEGTDEGPDRSFTTYPKPVFDPSCKNNLARQQTGAAFLLDCRAYELVSAESQGGYNVTSNLLAGQTPFAGFPDARGRALYAIHNGGIPGVGKPTNRGPDPYLAVRNPQSGRWSTQYVGIPADAPSAAPFSSTVAGADRDLRSFAFGGPEICDPCFADGSAGMPLRSPGGELGQGMVGSIPVADPEPAGEVRKPLSADGSHFLFASKQRFEPEGNSSGTDVTVYDRDLEAGTTQVVSTLPSGETIEAGEGVAALDVSADGSRILIGRLVSTDSQGNRRFDLFMHIGTSPNSVEVADTPSGVLYAGMTADGTEVFFTTPDQLAGEGDSSADLFRAEVETSGATVSRVSVGEGGAGDTDACDPAGNSLNPDAWNALPGGTADCSVLALGGGGGVARDSGAVYFLSPERLDGQGEAGAPNLFVAEPGEGPSYVATLESGKNSPPPPPSPVFDSHFGSFASPSGAAIDGGDGSFYVLDQGASPPCAVLPIPGGSVHKFSASGNPDTGFGTGGVLGGICADGLGVLAGVFGGKGPVSIALDSSGGPSDGTLYVPDLGTSIPPTNSAIKKFDASGAQTGSLPVGPLNFASGVSVDQSNGDVYAAAISLLGTSQVLAFDQAGAPIVSFPVTGKALDTAVDSSHRVYVANGADVRVYAGASGVALGVLDPSPAIGVAVDPGAPGDPDDDVVYVDRGDEIAAFDPATKDQIGDPIGSGQISGSLSLAAQGGALVVTNPGAGNVALFKPNIVSGRAYDHPLVLNGVRAAETRHPEDFQTTPGGERAVFPSTLDLEGSGFDSAGHYEVFRHDAGTGQTACVSCNVTGAEPTGDAKLASAGLSITDDGRVFFDSAESLVLRDANRKQDVYEWKDGRIELLSTGQSRFDSGLLTASSEGTDVFFFTRDPVASNDRNGTLMKLYTAREGGGSFTIPPPPPCVASDECHGPSSQAAPPVALGTLKGTGGNAKPQVRPRPRCRKGFARRGGRCVKQKKRKNQRKRAAKRNRRVSR